MMPNTPPRTAFGVLAAVLTALLVLGSAIYWFFALTFGLISGLVVLLMPLYPLLVQGLVAGILVSVCLWRGAHRLALGLGLITVLAPQAALVAWYGHAWWACRAGPDPDECFAHLNGSVLLPIFVFASVALSAVEAAVLVGIVSGARRVLAPTREGA